MCFLPHFFLPMKTPFVKRSNFNLQIIKNFHDIISNGAFISNRNKEKGIFVNQDRGEDDVQ